MWETQRCPTRRRRRRSGAPDRWSAQAKSEVVLRLMRGEAIDQVSRAVQVPAHQIETWRRDFLEAGVAGLKKRAGDVEARALKQPQAKVGRINDEAGAGRDALGKKGVRG